MRIFPYLLLLVFFFLTAYSCRIPRTPEEASLSVMTWNVQNLFDAVSDGTEYREFDPARSDWDEDLLRIRLENLSQVILSATDSGPDLILLQEVENAAVLEQLNREYLGDRYPYSGVAMYTENSIHSGYLSRYPPEKVHVHLPGEYGDFPLRAILELHFILEGEELVVLNNHWKSRSGGFAATEAGRVASSRAVSFRLRELREEGVTTVIVAGDFNGSREDYYPGGRQTAQIPLEYLPDTPWMDSLFVTYDPAELPPREERAVLFSPWGQMTAEGSYFFQNRWMMLDHFLLGSGLSDGSGWEYKSAACLSASPFCSDQGYPLPWASWSGSGYSDHFPLLLELIRIE